MRDFSLLLNSNPTSLVLHFYAGLTGLYSRPVRELLRDIGRNPPGYDCIRHDIYATQIAGGDPRRRFLTYFHCLYEANVPDVLVKPKKSNKSKFSQVHVEFYSCRLTIHDLNVIAYYILSMARTPGDLTCTNLSFANCFIDDHGYEAFVATLTEQAQQSLAVGDENSSINTFNDKKSAYRIINLIKGTFFKVIKLANALTPL